MAVNLNKNRMMMSRILVAAALAAGFLTAPVIVDGTALGGLMKLAGFVLLTACAIGRIYSTAFIGGVKNKELMTAGPYAAHRNPLYFYSLLGAAGVGLMSLQVTTFAVLFCGFLILYVGLIDREEKFLAEKFGEEFARYKARVPRLLPDFKKYTAPAEMLFQPKYLAKAVADAVWWFAPVPLFEFARYLQETGVIEALMVVP